MDLHLLPPGPALHRLLTRPVPPDLLQGTLPVGPRRSTEVELTWLGAAGFAIDFGEYRLLIDPYVSRYGLRRTLLTRLRPDRRAIARYALRADVIVCTHSHYDHILDVPEIARLTRAKVVGSAATCNYCRAWGLPERQMVQVRAPRTIFLPPFSITIRPSVHGRAVMGRVPLQGTISRMVHPPLRASQLLSDTHWGVQVELLLSGGPETVALSIFHLGSAAYLPETLAGLRCDVLLPCLVGRRHHPGYTWGLVRTLGPGVVIPCHFDDFLAPLESPLRELPGADLAGFLAEVRAADAGCRTVVLDLLGQLRLGLQDRRSCPTSNAGCGSRGCSAGHAHC